jgi:MoxR-like ATPase
VNFGYPTPQEEWEVLQRRMARRQEAQTVGQVTDAEGLLAMQQAIEGVTVDETVGQYCVRLVDATRRHQHLLMGSSPRGSLALLLTARAYAVVQGRDYVTPEDVKAVAHACLDHRVTVRPELWMNEVTSATVVESILTSTPAPGATAATTASASAFTRP